MGQNMQLNLVPFGTVYLFQGESRQLVNRYTVPGFRQLVNRYTVPGFRDIDLVVHGDDYSDEQRRHFYKVPIEMGILRTVAYTKGISTTEIIRRDKESQLEKMPVT